MTVSNIAQRIVTEAGIGYALGYLGLVANPVAATFLAATIACVKEVTRKVFGEDLEKVSIVSSQRRILTHAYKLGYDTMIGTLIGTFIAKVVGKEVKLGFTAVPVIHLIAFAKLTDYGRDLLTAAYWQFA